MNKKIPCACGKLKGYRAKACFSCSKAIMYEFQICSKVDDATLRQIKALNKSMGTTTSETLRCLVEWGLATLEENPNG